MITVDESSNGKEIVLHIGDALKVSLHENASTGYKWTVRARPGVLRELEGSTLVAPKGPPGSGGARQFHFEATENGFGILELEYRRSWEHAAKPARSFQLRVRVE